MSQLCKDIIYGNEWSIELLKHCIQKQINIRIVGGGKVAREIANSCAEHGKQVQLIDPKVKCAVPWPLKVNGIALPDPPPLFSPKWSVYPYELAQQNSPNIYKMKSISERIAAKVGYATRKALCKLVNTATTQATPKQYHYHQSFEFMNNHRFTELHMVPLDNKTATHGTFFQHVESGLIQIQRGFRFQRFGVNGDTMILKSIDDGSLKQIKLGRKELIIMGTGWKLSFDFLRNKNNDLQTLIANSDGSSGSDLDHICTGRHNTVNLWLYRKCISPLLPPRIAFNGMVGGFDNQVPAYLVAAYLVYLMRNKIELPSKEDMIRNVGDEIEWRIKNDYPCNYQCEPLRWSYYMSMFEDFKIQKPLLLGNHLTNTLMSHENHTYHLIPFESNP
eukprot:836113_1